MLRDVEWSEDRTYRTGEESEPLQFYLDALSNSTHFDLLLGYFSSAAINILSLGFAKFLSTGGIFRLIVNDILSENDKNAIKAGLEGKANPLPFELSNVKALKATLDDYGKHFFECISWLIAQNKIQLRIIRPREGAGIAHYKEGVFSDSIHQVGFTASCNFTAFGLLENLEVLSARLNWDDERSNLQIKRQVEHFHNIYNGSAQFFEYVDIENIKVVLKNEFGNKDINELLVQEEYLINKKIKLTNNPSIKKALEKTQKEVDQYINEPKFPYKEGPRDYQNEAYDNWVRNGYKGMFAMATGTGKTLTSLNCLLNTYKEIGTYKAVILVPTIALVNQWVKECKKFNFNNIITVSSKEDWQAHLAFKNAANNFIKTSFIIIVTYSSFYRSKFQAYFKSLPDDTLLIADEVHNMGSPKLLQTLPKIHLTKRIGLSATPNRKYDELGNTTIESFFHDRPPFILSYSMERAIENGWLCKYTYFPHVVKLTEQELEEYIGISKQLLKYFDSAKKAYKPCKEVELLLLTRKRIIHKAESKKAVFEQIIEKEFRRKGDLKYTLIYVPEGSEADYDKQDELIEDSEDELLIDEYTRSVSAIDTSVLVKQYTAKTKNRETVLKDFASGTVHVLTSMKCLDEGVDVPRSELAIFCASTGNPRQFIQRRGRVLRLHNDKIYATIHDLVVVPKIDNNEDTYEMERSMVKKELERVVDFSSLAINKMDTYENLKDVLEYYNLNLNDFELQ
jgi:superfamily II DNA or RNA helicase